MNTKLKVNVCCKRMQLFDTFQVIHKYFLTSDIGVVALDDWLCELPYRSAIGFSICLTVGLWALMHEKEMPTFSWRLVFMLLTLFVAAFPVLCSFH